jgi:hypothetical protein
MKDELAAWSGGVDLFRFSQLLIPSFCLQTISHSLLL